VNLFAKIFLGFWLSTAAIIGSWLIAGRYVGSLEAEFTSPVAGETGAPATDSRPDRPPAAPPAPRPKRPLAAIDIPPGSIYRIFYGLQNTPGDALEAWIRQREVEDNVDIRLVDEAGQEIFQRELLPGSAALMQRLEGFRRRAVQREQDRVLFGQELYRPEWGSLRMIIASRPPSSEVARILMQNLWLRLLLALLISGAISYGVSRYLTRPLKRLQLASRELAGGNLSARIQVPERRGDETDALARDFNTMASQLEEKIIAQRRLLSDVSHELRSPLARMRVALALAEREPGHPAEQLERIERETLLLDDLVGQLLSTPDRPADMEDSLDLVALFRSVCDDAQFEAGADDKALDFQSSVKEAVVRTHGDLLKRALENVIRNAVRHTPAGSTVEVALRQTSPGGVWMITVADCGPGVPEDELEQIFAPFYRVDEARQRETGGFGLGLSIARRAIEQHGGRIRAENRATGGLVVILQLPHTAEA
jgi:two-component system sensor histidine kinase CpxA